MLITSEDLPDETRDKNTKSSQQQVPLESSGGENKKKKRTQRKDKEKCSKKVHIAFLPEPYEPLIEEDETEKSAKEEKKQKKKQRYKKYRKNVGRALRLSWRCLLVGLQSFAAGYSTPVSAAAAFIPNPHGARART